MPSSRLILAAIIIAASACNATAQAPQLWKQKTGSPTTIVPAGSTPYTVEIPSTQLRLKSSGSSSSLTFGTSEALTADRALTWSMGDAARTITLSGNPTLNDWFNQSTKTTASPTFIGVTTGAGGVTVGGGGAVTLKAYEELTNGTILLEPNGATRLFQLGVDLSHLGSGSTILRNTAATDVTLPTTGTLYSTKSGSITSAELATSLTDETGTGTFVRNTSPTFATDINVGSDAGTTITATRASTNTGGPVWFTRKARGTQASPTAVSVGDALGTFLFQGYTDGYRSSAAIAAIADTGYGATGTDAPGALIFYTTPDGSATQTERARLTSSGTLGVGSSTPLGQFETRSTTGPQLVTGYSASQYLSSSTTSGGVTTLTAAGTTPTIDLSATSGVSINAGSAVKRQISATATLDWGSIAASTDSDLTITVAGATVGDVVQLGPPSTLEANLAISYYAVTATNTVTIRLRNLNAVGAIDPASKTWRAAITGF